MFKISYKSPRRIHDFRFALTHYTTLSGKKKFKKIIIEFISLGSTAQHGGVPYNLNINIVSFSSLLNNNFG